ncbi:SWI/SNF and RSC complexes subunit ssr3 [Colletotrichum sp. SAR 10_99]|nr:SWI/SNF and RSC complexes subunit ssr3 [Colletotrichum sp. SAR 10_96]KAI8275206.1 SWI/SNF and RSC complexes subunit ssr3 [Colletotrichum sp. SAR 10_98]KAJ5012653.1 SWI/SNF and RSC complexes subunit ssr3 [Colletotrichum sp. SAR 10_99]
MPPGHHQQAAINQATIAQHHAPGQALTSELAKRRSRKPTDKTLPDGVEDCITDSEVAQRYKELRDFERRLDATMTRKRLDIVEAVGRNAKRYKTLRVWISNTVEDQAWQGSGLSVDSFDFTPSAEPSYRVKIEARLLDDDQDESVEDVAQNEDQMDEDDAPSSRRQSSAPAPQKCRFSRFFKALNVEFDRSRSRAASDQTVEWKRQSAQNATNVSDFDEFTFKRSGDENMNITVNLHRLEDPERYLLSPELAEVVDMIEASRQEAVLAVWEYIKMMGLQEDEEKRNFRCDDLLRKVPQLIPLLTSLSADLFAQIINGNDVGMIPNLNDYIQPHLRPLPPISLPYTVRVDETFHQDPQPTVYDVRVAIEEPLRSKLVPFVANPAYASALKNVATLDEQLATLVSAIAMKLFEMDVSILQDWERLKIEVNSILGGRIDLLVLNAGVGGKSSWQDLDSFHRIIDTNLYGIVNGINTLLPLVGNGQSSQSAVVITGSKQGITNPPGNPAYNASKAAVKSVAEHLSFDLRNTATTAHLLVPGWTFTGLAGAGSGREKPAAAWSPEQVAEYLEQKMELGLFYIICPDNEVTEDLDRKRMLWGVGDIVHGRPPLSRWREEYKEKAQQWIIKDT